MLTKPCLQCGRPSKGPRCPKHTEASGVGFTQRPGEYDAAWDALSRGYRRDHPTCQHPGCSGPSEQTDHIISVRKRPDLRLERSNLQALCLHHHRVKTGRASVEARRRRGGEREP